jgi:hypothetical protein
MPSLSDVANQLNATLTDVSANTHTTAVAAGQIRAELTAANTKLDTIENTLDGGFHLMGQALFAIHEAQKMSNSLLLANSRENRTIICWLSIIADLLCSALRKMDEQIAIGGSMQESLAMLRAILELVHARETVEVERLRETQAQIERCCPPEEEEPKPCYRPCALDVVEPYHPRGQEWHEQGPD